MCSVDVELLMSVINDDLLMTSSNYIYNAIPYSDNL